ncbi:ras GTPase-activating-like protein IQGAP1 [Chelonus insularis]|uniref:ras GTPase-activating-like protein IQGAP1 n=1 Tax=Chelonus insularis TaxID=460826 RepID=UPI00158CD721|nr:ras GTPase-activating-like protein IQGAP1 [Chelonus insularis]
MTGAETQSIIPSNDIEVRKSAEEMDEQRQKTLVYEYLCHLEEAKKWIEACLREKLPPTTELEENLRNGVYLAKIAHFMDPEGCPWHKIYDMDQCRFKIAGLQFKHTENINMFLKCLKSIQLPLTFQPETTDIYDKKNMPRVIYCIHALSTHLFKLGKAPKIQDLYGKINFTDAEIDAVSKELKKNGIQIPAFQKIGGLLLHSMTNDTATLHIAVIAINQALTDSNKQKLKEALCNPVANLKNIRVQYLKDYYSILFRAKNEKTEAACNRSLNESYVPDTYDELLTPAEIQGHVNNVNAFNALQLLTNSIEDDTNENFIKCLADPSLQLKRIVAENANEYRNEFRTLIRNFLEKDENFNNLVQWQHLLQKKTDRVNEKAIKNKKIQEAVKSVNLALEKNSEELFFNALMNPQLGISEAVDKFSVPLYFEEMKIDKSDSGRDISYDDILSSIRVLTAIASVSKAIDTGNPDLVFEALINPETHVTDLDEGNKVKYFKALETLRSDPEVKKSCPILTYVDIQDVIDLVNKQCQDNDKAIDALKELNKAVLNGDPLAVMAALKNNLVDSSTTLSEKDSALYLKLFKKCLEKNSKDRTELWLEDVNFVTKVAGEEIAFAQNACHLLGRIDKALTTDDIKLFTECLEQACLKLNKDHSQKYFDMLKSLKQYKAKKYKCPYVIYVTPRNTESFLHIDKQIYSWSRPLKIAKSRFITIKDIEKAIITVTAKEYNLPLDAIKESAVIHFQALVRGYLLRKKLSDRKTHFQQNQGKVIKIQAWWRSILQRRYYLEMRRQEQKISKLQEKKQANKGLDFYQQNEHKIIRIQAHWRGRKARKAFVSLLRMEKPPFPVVRHFASILDFNAEDYDKELQLQQLKHEVVQTIKHNQKLSQQLNSMDIKIGLLIQNRITLQDVIAHGKSLESLTKEKNTRSRKSSFNDPSIHKGLKSLTKEGRKMLEAYQHLFYALQTNPVYLSKLLFLLPQSKSNKFLQNVILTLYNFGSNLREEYLLLKLFGKALQEEIRSKFQKPSEVVTGNPLVLKMVVNYARQLNGQRALRQILGPVIEKVLADKSICIETNPVDIYKCWRNQLEMKTGETLDLPYSVTQQQALNYEEVRKKLSIGIEILRNTVRDFLQRITESRDLIPYGMLYVSKVLHDTLAEKFPNSAEKDILKVVGNLIYYHFINAAIVAPDAFDIVTLPIDRSLSNDQRRNLASIAKILQFAASKKGFGDEAPHLVCLNPFIIECHEKFKNFFRSCCQIEELDDHFNIGEYTEATLIHKPEISISLQEICDTHSLLLEYRYEIAPDTKDSLHELLDNLQSPPTIAGLMGITEPVCDTTLARMGKTEICLVLSNKFEVPGSEDQSLQRLFIKTKELLVCVIQFLKGDTLVSALDAVASPVQEKRYGARNVPVNTASLIYRSTSSLDDCKFQLRSYLLKLERGGWVTHEDGYQSLVTAVAKDLCNKGKYRMIRNKELQMLRATRQRLQEKTKYYAEQVEYYNEYIKRCLENLHTGKGTLRAAKISQKNNQTKLKSKKTLQYSAAKLFEKGILKEIDGLPNSQFKNVTFEITPREHYGLFTIKGKFMGVEIEKIEIDIQKLLEMQFEGAAIMNLFGKAKVNVNLLLYLLNRKFYGKT